VTTIINTPYASAITPATTTVRQGGDHRAREHQGEHGEDAGVRRGQRAVVPAVEDLHDDADDRQGRDQIDLHYFGARTPAATRADLPGAAHRADGRHVRVEGRAALRYANGGSCVEYPKTVAAAARSLKNIDTVIPGTAR
jgi:hypothetical protein